MPGWLADAPRVRARSPSAGREARGGLVACLPSAPGVSGRDAGVSGGRTARSRPIAECAGCQHTAASGRNATAAGSSAACPRPLAKYALHLVTGGAWRAGRVFPVRPGREWAESPGQVRTTPRVLARSPEIAVHRRQHAAASGRNASTAGSGAARFRPLATRAPGSWRREARGGHGLCLPSALGVSGRKTRTSADRTARSRPLAGDRSPRTPARGRERAERQGGGLGRGAFPHARRTAGWPPGGREVRDGRAPRLPSRRRRAGGIPWCVTRRPWHSARSRSAAPAHAPPRSAAPRPRSALRRARAPGTTPAGRSRATLDT
jgi:hypothetical protein